MRADTSGESLQSPVTHVTITVELDSCGPSTSRESTLASTPIRNKPSTAGVSPSSASALATSSPTREGTDHTPESIRPSFISNYEVSI